MLRADVCVAKIVDMDTVMQNLNYIIAFCCGLLALHLLRAKPVDRWPSTLLGLSFVILAIQSLLMNSVALWGRQTAAGLLLPCFALLIGPLFFLTFERAAKQGHRFTPLHGFHLMPSVLVFLMLNYQEVWVDIDLMIILSFFTYSILLWRLVFKGEAQFAHLSASSQRVFQWLVAASVVMVLALISELLILNEILRGYDLGDSPTLLAASVIKLLSVGFVVFSALQDPGFFDWVVSFGRNATRRTSLPECQEKMETVAAEFVALVDSRHLFAREDTSLKSVSKQLGISPRLLSESINYVFNQSFSKYMNVRRVAEAKRLLETSDASITQLMYDAGFRTKSNFNKEFKASLGVSPTEYRDGFRDKPSGNQLAR